MKGGEKIELKDLSKSESRLSGGFIPVTPDDGCSMDWTGQEPDSPALSTRWYSNVTLSYYA